jgi:hypothetical protein
MKTSLKTALLAAITAGSLLCAAQLQAGFVFDYSAAVNNQTFSGTLGNNFVVNSTVIVNRLGVFSQDTPVGQSIPIAIYQHDSSASATAGWSQISGTSFTISSSDLLDLASQTRYINIAPVTLTPGLYSVVTVTSSDYNSQSQAGGSSLVTFNSLGAPLTQGAYDIWGTGLNLDPTLSGLYTTGPGNPSWPWPLPVFGAGTFSVVPEPATLIAGALLLLPFGASTVRVLRRRA